MTPDPAMAVEQVDREAADLLDDALGFLTATERPIVEQAFARHRLAATRDIAMPGLARVNGSDPRPDRNCNFCGPGWKGAHKHGCPRAHEDTWTGGPIDD